MRVFNNIKLQQSYFGSSYLLKISFTICFNSFFSKSQMFFFLKIINLFYQRRNQVVPYEPLKMLAQGREKRKRRASYSLRVTSWLRTVGSWLSDDVSLIRFQTISGGNSKDSFRIVSLNPIRVYWRLTALRFWNIFFLFNNRMEYQTIKYQNSL